MRSLAVDTVASSNRGEVPIPDLTTIVLPVFAGQGTTRTSLRQAADQAIRDADSPTGSLLLSSCLDVFLAELAALSPEDLDQSGICPSDFADPPRLLTPDAKYAENHVISGIFLFLAQVLRYQSHVHTTSRSFLDLLQTNTDHAVGVLGLSSGIFPACVVAASRNPLSYITIAVEVFRLVFWIALRVLQSTRKLLKERPVDVTLPWSVACLGLTKADVEQQIARFEQKHCRVPSLRVTAVLDERNVTISGRPDLLVRFSTFVSRHCTVLPTTVGALYHSELHLPDTRDRIFADIQKRNIRFPDYQDLRCPLRSTISGDIAKPSSDHPSLVDLVVDMVLVHPVNWDLVAKKVAFVIPVNVALLAINIGPGSSTLRALERVVPECVLRCIDVTSDTRGEAAPTPAKQEPIAIIGMAAHTPGATNTAELWEVLETGINTVSKIPDDRFKLSSHSAADVDSSPCELKVEMGNFLTDFADFDHKFFKISPREARSMDPQQRVLLHTAYEALESAGYVPDATPCFRRATFGCYIGAATQDYAENLADNIDIHYSTGTLRAFLSGRISYAMQFGGPSVVVDTACSSSIVAIHQACRALMTRDCDAALAGGVNIMTSPNMFAGLERGHFLSPTGQCKSFDASADGYSRGEGCCLFVLKRLSDAIAENDNIMGVIRGVEVNQSGLAPSITHPHSPTQADLLKTLIENSGICPTRVSVVEAHGTGTEAGDSCELASIRSVLSNGRTRDNPLHVTSIKANIGHLEGASGAVGLCKLLLMLRHNVIPAQISLKTLHPLIAPLDVDNTIIDTLPTAWVPESTPRVAVLNNFGAAGSNGALILEEYIKPDHPSCTSSFVFGISAKSVGALERLRSRYQQWLGDALNSNAPLGDIAYTATACRQLYPFRLVMTARDNDQLIRALDTTPVTHVEPRGGQVIFVFSGQGSQYLNMGGSLYATSPVFRNCIDRCQRCLVSLGYPGFLPIISSEACNYVFGADEEFEAHQCAILAVEFALATLWKHWGVVPVGVIGQSLGEYAAMVTADVLSIETALSIVAKRARLMSRGCAIGETGMVSVNLSSAQVQEILIADTSFSNVTVACVNTESSCVVSGPVEELQTLTTHLTTTFGCKTVSLQVPLGFHSSAMDPILEDLRDHVATLPVHPPTIPIASNVYGTVIPVGDSMTFQADYFAKHCRQPVLFSRGLQELEQCLDASQIDAWIDVGPQAICLPMIEATLSPSRETLCLPSLLKETPAWDSLTGSLAQLYRTTVPVDWRRVFDERAAFSCVDLPSYPFDSQKFWVSCGSRALHATPEPTLQCRIPDHPMLSSWSQYPSRQNGNAAIFETPINCLANYMEGHKVGGYALCPASVYLEQALAGAVITQRYMELDFGRCMPVLRAVEFSRSLVLRQGIPLIIRIHVTVHEDGTGSFSITSRLESSREEHVHVHGDLRFSSVRETTSNLALELPGIARRAEGLTCPDQAPEVFSTHTAYEVVFPRVVEYAEDYHTVQSLTVSGDGASGVARVVMSGSLGVQPVFLDTMLHVAGFMVNLRGDVSDAYICSSVGLLKVLRDLVDDKQPYTVHCTTNWISSRDFVTADIVAVQQYDPPVVVAQLRGAQFRRVRLTSLHRGLAIAADPGAIRNRTRTDSNSIVTPASPRSVIFGRSRSNTLSTVFCGTSPGIDKVDIGDAEEYHTTCSGPTSPQTLVSEGGGMFEKRHFSGMDGERIRNIMSEVLGIADSEEIKGDTDLGSLGLDSLGSIEAQQALRVALNRPIPHNIFTQCPTLSALCEFLVDDLNDADVSSDKIYGGESQVCHPYDVAFVSLQQCPGSLHVPLYLVHDGSGLVSDYERLLPLHRDVWGLSNPRFFCDEPWETLEDMAQAYASMIEQHASDAALMLGGWSFGGVVAFEIARILIARGVRIQGVVLIDSPFPSAPPLLSDSLIDRLLRDQERTLDSSMTALVVRQFKQSTALLDGYVPTVRDAAVSLAFLRCTAGFFPDDVEDVPAWFRERDDAGRGGGWIVEPWGSLVGGAIPVWDVPGHHFEPLSRVHVEETSVQLDRACRYLETL
ncbi:putative polyketide synthase [Imleria badia]|nr:putative polyketide synthase [Imleria badia]